MKNTQQGNKRRKKKGSKSKQKTTPESMKRTMGSPNTSNQERNLGPKPITSSMKQVVQGNGWKTL